MKFIQQAIKTIEACEADLEFLVSNSWMILVTVMSMTCRLANFNSFSIAIFICEIEEGEEGVEGEEWEEEEGGGKEGGGSTIPQRMCHYLYIPVKCTKFESCDIPLHSQAVGPPLQGRGQR